MTYMLSETNCIGSSSFSCISKLPFSHCCGAFSSSVSIDGVCTGISSLSGLPAVRVSGLNMVRRSHLPYKSNTGYMWLGIPVVMSSMHLSPTWNDSVPACVKVIVITVSFCTDSKHSANRDCTRLPLMLIRSCVIIQHGRRKRMAEVGK